ncbi:uncharacterized protein FIESC28_04720 [Fusarium coffeatum]|uniref:Heterokaryon incompatibility domain-containing protein n=1 Tax=Fusarium coffeatum TaxID=231269 RepID=A0A366RXR9_9HYPO|nr:uncharacterized protein FIESC28_04720 [Fusarium coffeatum]RBR21877.1 hypothetical protein FIESC28_04720 [Fusarium coffeatum]
MRLINVESLELESFVGDLGRGLPTYAILSHVWTNEEVSYQQMTGLLPLSENSKGYWKIIDFCAKARNEGFDYAWIDTCCIDKTSSAELSEAINSMFQWYRDSAACYVYLEDVRSTENPVSQDSAFRRSRWFTRGWTLQELLAPHEVIFCADDWQEIGTKASLSQTISAVTKIDVATLRKHTWAHVSVAMIMSWASMRQTTRLEDQAYSLLGLFDVNMPLIYGEGQKAFYRLQIEIMKLSNDDSLFAWSTEPLEDQGYSAGEGASSRGFRFLGLLAPSVLCFRDSHDIMAPKDFPGSHSPYDIVKENISLSATLVRLCPLPVNPNDIPCGIDKVDVVGTVRFSKNVHPVKAVDHGLVITPARQDSKGMKVMCLLAILRCWNKDGYIAIPIKKLSSVGYQRVEHAYRCRWFRVRLMPLRLCLKDEDEKAENESIYRLRQYDSEYSIRGPPADPPETILIKSYVPLDLSYPSSQTSTTGSLPFKLRSLPLEHADYILSRDSPENLVFPLPESRVQAHVLERFNKIIGTDQIASLVFQPMITTAELPPFSINIATMWIKKSEQKYLGVHIDERLGCYYSGPSSDPSGDEITRRPRVEFVPIDPSRPCTTIPLSDKLCLVFRVRQGIFRDASCYINVGIEKKLEWGMESKNDSDEAWVTAEDALSRRFTDVSI